MMTLPSPPATKTVEIDMVNALFLLSEMKKKKKKSDTKGAIKQAR